MAGRSNNYVQVRTKLQRDYRRAFNIQNDLLQKFTTELANNYDQIVIEDLNVKQMMMTHVASKGIQRSLFGKFRQILSYKC
ncbi:transposase, partial [Staphylococcus epidermidis]|nr:transposase [Staphylococcus epidermidis]